MNIHTPEPRLSWYSRTIREIEQVALLRKTNSESNVLSERLARLHAVLDRLERGDFGRCTNCDKEIEVERLEEDVASPLCGTCYQLRTL